MIVMSITYAIAHISKRCTLGEAFTASSGAHAIKR